jgi:hypothetical protein
MIVKNDGAERMIKSPMVMAKAVAELEADAAVERIGRDGLSAEAVGQNERALSFPDALSLITP